MRAFLVILSFVLSIGSAFAQSTINPSLPESGLPYSSAPIRNNFQAAYNDINALYQSTTGAMLTSAANALSSAFGNLVNAATAANARYSLGPNNSCNVVTDFGANPAGTISAPVGAANAAAFNSCAAVTKNGQNVNIYAPAGTYYVTAKIALSHDQCLYGDGSGNTIFLVDQGFSSNAVTDPGVIVVSDTGGGGDASPACVHDIAINFAQPSDQGTRANFKTLAAGCTSGTGGFGCKYPPAIYMPSGQGGEAFWNIIIRRSWDSINIQSANSIYINNIKEGALNVGLTMANGFNFSTINNFMHFPWGITGALYSGVYSDGNAFAASLGELDGAIFSNFQTFRGRIELTSAFTWGTFNNLMLDGDNSTLEVSAALYYTPGLQINGVYATGAASGANTHCQIDIGAASGLVTISNPSINAAGPGVGGICVAGGNVNITGGRVLGNGINAVNVTGGKLSMVGTVFDSPDRVFSADEISVATGGTLSLVGTTHTNLATNGQTALAITTDNVNNLVSGNALNSWAFVPPGAVGYYEATGRFNPTLSFGFVSTDITYAEAPQGTWTQRGKNMHIEYQITLSNKGSATGQANINAFPIASAPSYAGNCSLSFQTNMSGLTGAISATTTPGFASLDLYQSSATGSALVTDANFTNSTEIIGACDYLNAL